MVSDESQPGAPGDDGGDSDSPAAPTFDGVDLGVDLEIDLGDTLANQTHILRHAPPSRFLPSGTVLGDTYVILEVIGEGGMGVVYQATDRVLNREVAVKVLHANLMGDQGIRKRFHREASVMTRWTHPNIATVYDLVDTENAMAIVMERIVGASLRQTLHAWRGPLPLDLIGVIFAGVLDAMSSAHAQGIVHRDLKPENIILRRDPDDGVTPKVIDFGIVKILEGTTYTLTGTLLGTARYMSPEQAQRPEALDHRSDIYSIGILLYELACGRTPFEHENHFTLMMDHVTRTPQPPGTLRADIPEALEALILDCLAKAPDDRPASCDAIRERLFDALGADAPGPTSAVDLAPIEHPHGATMLPVQTGIFLMGSGRREVWLEGFHLDRLPVTNRQFERFLTATGYQPDDEQSHRFLAHWPKGRLPKGLEAHPVVYVSWTDARAYATWAGLRLPSEAEWEKAARGLDGRRFPWGKEKPTAQHASFDRQHDATRPVGSWPAGASPFGVEDLAGNIWEWCEDVDDPAFYRQGPDNNPRNTVGAERATSVVRGGAWMFDARSLRTSARSSFPPTWRLEMIGFRCAR